MPETDPLVPVLAGLVADIMFWLDSCDDEEVNADSVVKMMDTAAGVLGRLPEQQRARLVQVVDDLASAEQDARRKRMLRQFPFATGLVEEEDEGEAELVHTISVCPVGKELVAQILTLAEVDAGDPEALHTAIEALGWPDPDELADVDARFCTEAGHPVLIEDRLTIPFLFEHWIGADSASPTDYWGEEVAGWTSRTEPSDSYFAECIEEVVALFAAQLGAPALDEVTDDRRRRRVVAWRMGDRDTSLLVVGRTSNGFVYHQDDAAVICLLPWEPGAPVPTAADLVERITV